MNVRRTIRRWAALALAGVAFASSARGDESGAAPPPGTREATEPTSGEREPAADGTTSVVVPPPAEPSNPISTEPPAEPSPAVEKAAPASPGFPAVPVQPPSVLAPPARPTAMQANAAPAPVEAAALLESLLQPLPEPRSAGSPPTVRPVTLLEAIERAADPSRRLWVTQAYWKVSTAFASLRTAGEALERLELVAPGGDPHDRAVLDVAAAAARADLADARAQLGVAQQDLMDLARLPLADPPPWPVDRPLATAYQTHFDAIFANRIATGRVRAIARTLPARHEALEARAAAVGAAAAATARAEADHAKGNRPIEAVIAAHAALVAQQREFLQAVKAYNLDIAEYAMAVADFSVPDDRFVSMLIGTPIQVRPQPASPAGLTMPAPPPAGGGVPAEVPVAPLEAVPPRPAAPPGG